MRNKGLASTFRALCVAVCGGALLASSCSNSDLQNAVLVGVNAATGQLVQSNQRQEVSILDVIQSVLNH